MKNLSATIEISSDTVFLRPLDFFLRQFLTQLEPFYTNDHLLDSVELIVHEALVNIIKHAYKSREDGEIKIQILWTPETLSICFEDRGVSFDPDAVPTPNLDEPSVGGIGLWLIRQMVDEFHYQSEADGRNILRLIKHAACPP